MALHTKLRPKVFTEVIGHISTLESIQKTLAKKDKPHTWLFTGMSGIGKTTIARIVAGALLAKASGIIEVNAANLRKIDDMRELIKGVPFRHPGSPTSCYILDECHQLTVEAQNALLKALEEPPPHVYFLLCTTEPDKLLDTIRTRCQEYKLEPLGEDEIGELLARTVEAESLNVSPDVLVLIVENCLGSPRLALSMLEKCGDVGDNVINAQKLVEGMVKGAAGDGPVELAKKMLDLMSGKTKAPWPDMVKFLRTNVLYGKQPLDLFRRAVIRQLGNMVLFTPSLWAAQAALSWEQSLGGITMRAGEGMQNVTTDGGLIGQVYMLWASSTTMAAASNRTPSGDNDGRRRPTNSPTDSRELM